MSDYKSKIKTFFLNDGDFDVGCRILELLSGKSVVNACDLLESCKHAIMQTIFSNN